MDIFGGALASMAGMSWASLQMPAQGSVNIPAQGSVTMPAQGMVTMPAEGMVTMPAQGMVNMPPMPGISFGGTVPYAPGITEINSGFGSGVSQVVGGVTGTSNEIIVGPNPFVNVSQGNIEMPPYAYNPFPGYGPPNPFFAAQLFGGCNCFYSGFGSALSMFLR
jgi:hypothetical protein